MVCCKFSQNDVGWKWSEKEMRIKKINKIKYYAGFDLAQRKFTRVDFSDERRSFPPVMEKTR